VTFDGTASSDAEGRVISYAWTFGDGLTGSGPRVTHLFEDVGTFEVTLTVTDEDASTGVASLSIETREPPARDLYGLVWFDRDNDGARDAGEDGVEGVTVFFDDDGDGEPDAGERRTVSDAGGVYRFTGVEDGTYSVTQRLPVGWTNTTPGLGASPSRTARSRPAPAGGSPPLRIIEGEDAPVGAFPFQVSLQQAGFQSATAAHYCGGTLIAPSWVLTAGHCLTPENVDEIDEVEVVVGTHDITEGGARVPVLQMLIHPFYVPGATSFKRDLGLIELADSFPDLPRVFLVDSLLYPELVQPEVIATVVGWGQTLAGVSGSIPAILQTVEIPILADAECLQRYGDTFDGTMICAGFLTGGKSSCFGDSGGPLLLRHRNAWHEVGIVSWGIGCALPERPGVYARIASMMSFIEETVPPERSGAQTVTMAGAAVRADFGNFH
jgi:hypothetical protein